MVQIVEPSAYTIKIISDSFDRKSKISTRESVERN